MSPFSFMTPIHLRLQKASKGSVNSPSDSISLNDSALNNNFRLHHFMNINPNAFP